MARAAKTTKVPAPAAHALLGASSAHRWLHCPPSARLCEALPDQGSPYAREGTLAHELAALRLQQSFFAPMTKAAYQAARKKLGNALGAAAVDLEPGSETLTPEERTAKERAAATAAENAVGEYVDLIKDDCALLYQQPYNIYIEQRVDYSHLVPEGFGTCDCITIGMGGDGLWHMRVYDYKHGKGVPVEAENNPQLKLYALGALAMFAPFFPIADVTMVICQPRRESTTAWTQLPEELGAWGESIRPSAQQAFEGTGDFQEGDWCQFCRTKDRCRARAQRFTALEDFGYRKPTDPRDPLADEELGEVLAIGIRLDKWLGQLREYVQGILLAGGEVPGWKMVEGRAVRAFADQPAAFELAMTAGVEEALLYVREPITLTALESIMGKKTFADTLAEQIIRKPGKPALVPQNDPRPAITNRTTAAEDFDAMA